MRSARVHEHVHDTIVAASSGVVARFNDGSDSPSQGCGERMGNSVFLRHTLVDGSGSRNPDDYYGTVKVQRCA